MAGLQPSSTGAAISCNGVSIRWVVNGNDRVISYPINKDNSFNKILNKDVGVFLSLINVSLCWTRG